jgi:hypothetical protein
LIANLPVQAKKSFQALQQIYFMDTFSWQSSNIKTNEKARSTLILSKNDKINVTLVGNFFLVMALQKMDLIKFTLTYFVILFWYYLEVQ